MDKSYYKKIQEDAVIRYRGRLEKEGISPKTLGWGCKEDQIQRFEVICKNVDLNHKTILDVGCGFADFYLYLLEQGLSISYIGVDIIPEFIEYCRDKFPEARFYNFNPLLEEELIPQVDIIVSSGTMNFKLDLMDNMDYTKSYLKIAYRKANEKVIVDFLSTCLTPEYPREEVVYYHSPSEVLEFALSLSSNVELIHNYKPIPQKEFTLIITKEGVYL